MNVCFWESVNSGFKKRYYFCLVGNISFLTRGIIYLMFSSTIDGVCFSVVNDECKSVKLEGVN